MTLPITRRSLLLSGACLVAGCGNADNNARKRQDTPLWTDREREAIKGYWSASGRYAIAAAPGGPRINITVPGSTWYAGYGKALAAQPKEMQAAWTEWLQKRLASDRAKAAKAAAAPDPGPLPEGFKDAAGEPPPLYESVQPRLYTVTFAPADASTPYTYTDAVPFGDRPAYYGYLRSANGVRYFGRRVKDYIPAEKTALTALFARVAQSPAEQHVMQAVSALEGGFEAINTYDTGWVSIGFIQFITAINGDGSLAAVLARHKTDDAQDFAQTFHRFGLDVTPGIPVIACVDPASGDEKHGADAVKAIIADKRLTAVFQRAGERDGFRRAQIAVARLRYWPGDDQITVVQTTLKETIGGKEQVPSVYYSAPNEPLPPSVRAALDQITGKQKADPSYTLTPQTATLTARVSNIFTSEAGLATLMDRKVNRGSLGSLNANAARLMQEHHLAALADLKPYERDLVIAQKYRHDFLTDPTLTQPPPSDSPTEKAISPPPKTGTCDKG